MSRYKFDWWPQAIWAVRNYPARQRKYAELHRQSVTQQLTGMPGSCGVSRNAENIALKQLPPRQQQEYDAVTAAIASTVKMVYGKERKELIALMYWQGRKMTISQVAYRVNAGDALAKQWHREFIWLVGKNMGYISQG